jgi:hypothetical protein
MIDQEKRPGKVIFTNPGIWTNHVVGQLRSQLFRNLIRLTRKLYAAHAPR